eukprot:TRINITY_DN33900_c0_g1_i1.p1 TRINITY_DN33900_c0_g1~~TRINITY_DN33900_c0_g1_i1.p1  ORF type:complete len:228 (-),score=29.66 TRINITY_DN33900_c0_g1_i1:101-784(-)
MARVPIVCAVVSLFAGIAFQGGQSQSVIGGLEDGLLSVGEVENTTSEADASSSTSTEVCPPTRRNLDEDPIRRKCFKQCILGDDGVVAPSFDEWEAYCRETAGMASWDPECRAFLCCTFGCDIWGGDSTFCNTASPAELYEYLRDTKANMYAAGISVELRCAIEKCSAYCARSNFETCGLTRYAQKCTGSNPPVWGCDVDCNGAWHPYASGYTAAFLALGISVWSWR